MRYNGFRLPLFLACAGLALAQSTAPQEPVEAAIRAVRSARTRAEAAAARDQARALLQQAPITSPNFAAWVQEISQFYQTAGWNAKARSVLEDALARCTSLKDGGNLRRTILSSLAMAWQQDGNLLKTAGAVEQLAEAQEAATRKPAGSASGKWLAQSGVMSYTSYYSSTIETYSRLATLYRQLGRPEAVAALTAKVRPLAAADPVKAVEFYKQNELPEDAKAVVREMAEHSNTVQTAINALQALADIYASQQDFAGAGNAIRQAMATASASENPGIAAQVPAMQHTLINYLRGAGNLDQADTLYLQLVQQSQDGPQGEWSMRGYAQYLAQTQRVAQADTVLQEYLNSHPNLDPQAKSNIYNTLAGFAQQKGDAGTADRYRQEAQALQPQPIEAWNVKFRFDGEFQQATTAAREHRLDDAYNLAMHALDSAGQSVGGQQVDWMVPGVATSLANGGEPAKAERLFERLFTVVQDPSAGSIQRLAAVHKSYVNFLAGQPAQAAAMPAALDSYRRILIEVNGPDSASLADELRMRTQFELTQSDWQKARLSAGQLLEFEESTTGKTSQAYLHDLELAATVDEAAGDLPGALPMRRQAMAIADRFPAEWARSQTRNALVSLLDRLRQHEEATALRSERPAVTSQHVGIIMRE